jgi:hypothetical protein
MAHIFYLIVLEVRHRHEMEVLAASSEAGGENPSWPFPASRAPAQLDLHFSNSALPLSHPLFDSAFQPPSRPEKGSLIT